MIRLLPMLGLALLSASAFAAQTALEHATPAPQEMIVLRLNGGDTAYEPAAAVSMSGNRITVVYTQHEWGFLPPPPPPGGYAYRAQLGKLPAGDYTVDVMTRANVNAPATLLSSSAFKVAAAAGTIQPIADNTDLYFNPAESGWGFNVVQHGTGTIFATWFVYGADNQPQWYVMPEGHWVSPVGYEGPIYRTTGPDFSAAFDPSKVTRTPVGSGALTFAYGGLLLNLTVDGQTVRKMLQRQSF
jgi:hypothetical protein